MAHAGSATTNNSPATKRQKVCFFDPTVGVPSRAESPNVIDRDGVGVIDRDSVIDRVGVIDRDSGDENSKENLSTVVWAPRRFLGLAAGGRAHACESVGGGLEAAPKLATSFFYNKTCYVVGLPSASRTHVRVSHGLVMRNANRTHVFANRNLPEVDIVRSVVPSSVAHNKVVTHSFYSRNVPHALAARSDRGAVFLVRSLRLLAERSPMQDPACVFAVRNPNMDPFFAAMPRDRALWRSACHGSSTSSSSSSTSTQKRPTPDIDSGDDAVSEVNTVVPSSETLLCRDISDGISVRGAVRVVECESFGAVETEIARTRPDFLVTLGPKSVTPADELSRAFEAVVNGGGGRPEYSVDVFCTVTKDPAACDGVSVRRVVLFSLGGRRNSALFDGMAETENRFARLNPDVRFADIAVPNFDPARMAVSIMASDQQQLKIN